MCLLIVLCTFLLVSFSIGLSQDWYDDAWQYRQGITIDSDHVDFGLSGNLTQFPVLILLTDGSNDIFGSAQPDGDDILFTSSDGTTKIPHEIELYSDGSGSEELRAWVKLPSFSSSADTQVYIYYGNDSVSNQQTPTGVWDANFSGVWHLEEDAAGTGTSNLYQDSTSNSNDGDDLVSHAGKGGKIGRGQQFDGVDDLIDCGNDASLDVNYLTVEVWINVNAWINDMGIVAKGDNTYRQYWIWAWSGNGSYEIDEGGNINNAWTLTGSGWEHMALTWDGTNIVTYMNGVQEVSNPQATGTINPTTEPVVFGNIPGFQFWDGSLDEIRISSIARSADWIKASYVNQNNPQMYLSFQTEETRETADAAVSIKSNILRPARGETTVISYRLDTATKVTVTVYDLAGDRVNILYDGTENAGEHDLIWDGKNSRGRNVVPGVYYIIVMIDRQRTVLKALVVK